MKYFCPLVTPDAQEQVRSLRSNMLDTHRDLQVLVAKREGLARLWHRSLEYKESLKLLAQMYAGDNAKRVWSRLLT